MKTGRIQVFSCILPAFFNFCCFYFFNLYLEKEESKDEKNIIFINGSAGSVCTGHP
ncbi:MAG: hypothetical protein SCABRO_03428, partial [Candidatus Scalindua brodae]